MSATIVALHGFLGRGSDWDAVRAASKADAHWLCPDLFAPGAGDLRALPPFGGKAWLAGYSFGARLALRWLTAHPDRWHGALLLSVNPGNFQTEVQREERRQTDRAWARDFRSEAWDVLVAKWNAQDVFAGRACPLRGEKDFDRAKLAAALEDFSVADQFTDPLRLPSRLTWMAGGRDDKFAGLQTSMREAGFPGTFSVVDGAGHRLLTEAPDAVAAALDDLVA